MSVIQKLKQLIRFRNTHQAFNGKFELLNTSERVLAIRWVNGKDFAMLNIDLNQQKAEIRFSSWNQLNYINIA